MFKFKTKNYYINLYYKLKLENIFVKYINYFYI